MSEPATAGSLRYDAVVVASGSCAAMVAHYHPQLWEDRAGLLVAQDPDVALRVHMKLAGGAHLDQIDVDAFLTTTDCAAESLPKGTLPKSR